MHRGCITSECSMTENGGCAHDRLECSSFGRMWRLPVERQRVHHCYSFVYYYYFSGVPALPACMHHQAPALLYQTLHRGPLQKT